MNRRSFLATAALIGVAGCTSSETATQPDTTQPSQDSMTTAPSTTSSEQITAMEPNDDGEGQLGEMRYLLEDAGLDIQSFYFSDGEIVIEYVPGDDDSLLVHLSEMAYEYADHVEYDGRGEQVTARVLDDFGDVEVEYYIKRSWVETYNQDDDVNERKLIEQIADENNIVL